MALDLTGLQTNLKAAFDSTLVEGTTETDFVNAIASAIDTYVRTANIVYSGGLAAPGGGGPVTGTFIGDLD
jgi:hypothetical protein